MSGYAGVMRLGEGREFARPHSHDPKARRGLLAGHAHVHGDCGVGCARARHTKRVRRTCARSPGYSPRARWHLLFIVSSIAHHHVGVAPDDTQRNREPRKNARRKVQTLLRNCPHK